MSDANKDPHEPSMEEILASIRRIISEDNETPAEAPAPTKAQEGAAPAPAKAPDGAAAARENLISDVESEEDDVLVLTEEAEEETPQAAAPAADEPLTLEPEPEPEPVDEPPEPPRPEPAAAAPIAEAAEEEEPAPLPEPPPAIDRGLLSERAATASLAAMSELVTRSQREPNITSLPMGNADQTLEEITRALLRPMLKSWLDDNLPQIVERIVREEIGRLALDAQRR